MVRHEITASGVSLAGVVQSKPALLQINDDDFPKAFLQELSAMPQPAQGAIQTATANLPATLPTFPLGRRTKQLPAAAAIPVTRWTGW